MGKQRQNQARQHDLTMFLGTILEPLLGAVDRKADMKDIAAHELPILVPDSGPLSGVSPAGPTASTSGLYVFNVGVVEHRAIPNLKPDDLLVFSLELMSPGYKSQKVRARRCKCPRQPSVML